MAATTRSTAPILTAAAADAALRRYIDARATGHRLRWLRQAAGVTQTELGHALGLSRRTVERIENGERRMTAAEQVIACRILGASLGALRANQRRAA
jgi:DNA-binding XRE family transcriptional regulator